MLFESHPAEHGEGILQKKDTNPRSAKEKKILDRLLAVSRLQAPVIDRHWPIPNGTAIILPTTTYVLSLSTELDWLPPTLDQHFAFL